MMESNWNNQSFLKLINHSAKEITTLLDLAIALKAAKRTGQERKSLTGKNIALIFEKTSTRTRCAFEVACYDQGANCTYIGPGASQLGEKESVADTAQVLARFYDGIAYRGFAQQTVEDLAKYSGIPVYNALTDEFHPTQMLADLLTMQEHSNKPLHETSFAYLGDARYNMGNSLLLAGALMGMDVRIIAPKKLQPNTEIITTAQKLGEKSGAKITVSSDLTDIKGIDFIHTDIWVSMGEAQDIWNERVQLLMPYRISTQLLEKTANPAVKFMHCLPSYHDRNTPLGENFYQQHQLTGIEVADDIFNGKSSIVFDQAENRLHTIKALLVATLGS